MAEGSLQNNVGASDGLEFSREEVLPNLAKDLNGTVSEPSFFANKNRLGLRQRRYEAAMNEKNPIIPIAPAAKANPIATPR